MASFCHQCGAPLHATAAFCPRCGAPVAAPTSQPTYPSPAQPYRQPQPPAQPTQQSARTPSRNIVLCPDGKYRWLFEVSLWKNPTFILLIGKIFFFIFLGIFLFITLIDSSSTDFWWDGFLGNAKIFGFVFLGMIALLLISYVLYAAIMGGKYCVMFEMDNEGVNHQQVPRQAAKARGIAGFTMLMGAAAGNLSAVGAGMAAARTEVYSSFAKVKKVKAYPSRSLIKVNQTLTHNQVYAAPEDFDFVRSYITARCPNLKK